MNAPENILFAPLNWGLGHATRIVPLINDCINRGANVIIAAEGSCKLFLTQEFPELTFVSLPGYRIRYAPKPFFFVFLVFQMPLFLWSILREHIILNRLVKKHKIGKVISDNRYGLWHKYAHSILITHQLFIQLPKGIKWLESLLHQLTSLLIQAFSECWVPDYKELNKSLAGNLSHGNALPKNVKYIGPLSRFNTEYKIIDNADNYKVVVLISGPEPHRTQFEWQMTKRFKGSDDLVLMVCGTIVSVSKNRTYKAITKVSHLPTDQLCSYLKKAKKIVARSGYSTIMDLHTLGLRAEYIATPGQSEQEYLALWMNQQQKRLPEGSL